MNDPADFVSVASASSDFEAEAIAARLAASGIESRMAGPSRVDAGLPGGGAMPPIEIRVAPADADPARALLETPVPMSEDVDEAPHVPRPMPLAARIAFAITVMMAIIMLVTLVLGLVL